MFPLMIPAMPVVFHAHIYFELSQKNIASELRSQAESELKNILGISRLIERPIGPHPIPMFEIDFIESELGQIVDWLYRNRKGLRVLIHKDVKPETPEHSVNAIWIGQPLALDFSKLDLGSDDVHNLIIKP